MFLFFSFSGSYTSTPGINVVRQDIADFISQRDGYPAVSDDILLTDGGSEGIEVSLIDCSVWLRQLKLPGGSVFVFDKDFYAFWRVGIMFCYHRLTFRVYYIKHKRQCFIGISKHQEQS